MTAWGWWVLGFVIIVIGLGLLLVGVNMKAKEGAGIAGKIVGLKISPDGSTVPVYWVRNFTPPTDEDFVYQPWKEEP